MASMTETNLAYRDGEHPVHGTWLSVDVVAFTDDPEEARVVLIRRKTAPHRGAVTLPGGLLAAWDGETVEEAARRILNEKAGVDVVTGVIPVGVVSDRGRDERGHTVSIVVAALVDSAIRSGVPGAVHVEDVPGAMVFGHSEMVRKAVDAVDARLLTDPELTHALLGDITTARRVMALQRACSPQMAVSGLRGRWERCRMYHTIGKTPGVTGRGRPEIIYQWRGTDDH